MRWWLEGSQRFWNGIAGLIRHASPWGSVLVVFSNVEVRTLAPGVALVTGEFHLERTAAGGSNAAGRYTLILRKTSAGWKIIHDHTS